MFPADSNLLADYGTLESRAVLDVSSSQNNGRL